MPRVFLWVLVSLLFALAPPARAGWQSVGNVASIERQQNGVVLHADGGIVAVTALSPEVIRVRYAPSGSFGRADPWAVVDRALGDPQARIDSDATHVDLSTPALRVHIERNPLRIAFFDKDGHALDADDAEQGMAHAGSTVRVWKQLDDADHVYGFGEKTGRLDKRAQNLGGMHYAMWNSDSGNYDGATDPLYVSVPFYLVLRDGRAHGIFLDNTYRSSFDVGRDDPHRLAFGATGGDLDYYFIAGPDPKAVVERYTALTGRMPLPPRWALGYHQSRWGYFPELRLRTVADTLRVKHIPADTLWLDIDYQQDYKPFTWDRTRFPDPKRMLDDLRKQGFHVVTILDPHPPAERGYRIFDEGIAGNHFVRNADGSLFTGPVWPSMSKHDPQMSAFPDFTRAATRAWWGKHYGALLDAGVAGIWNDMDEPAVWLRPAGTMPDDVRFDGDGHPTDHREVHNVYGMLYSRATFEGLSKLRPDTRPFVLTRASFAGGQRYAAVWTGDNTADWPALRQSLPMLMNLGLSGFPFVGADIGGFVGYPSPELFTRWLQLGVFYPFMRAHTDISTPDQDPWSFGARYEVYNRHAIELRYRLLPTLYTVMEHASRSGVPALRPLFLEFPADAETFARDDEAMFGRDLLIAPVLYPDATTRQVYLPAGDWYDFRSDTRVAGGATIDVPVTLDDLPLYVRAGAFLFLQPVVQNTGEMAGQPLTVQVYPAAASDGALYEDDGSSLAYTRGVYARRAFHQQRSGDAITVAADAVEGRYRGAPRDLVFRLIGTRDARAVTLDGKPLPRVAPDQFDRADAAWTVRDGAVEAKLRDRPAALRLEVSGAVQDDAR